MPDQPARAGAAFRKRRLAIAAGAVAAVPLLVLLVLLVLAAFPWSLTKGVVASRLSRQLDRPVTIAAIERVGGSPWHPVVALRGLRAPQAVWAGSGDLISVREARIAFPLLPLLLGHFSPDQIDISGLRLALARDAAGRTNWGAGKKGGGARPAIRQLAISDAVISYQDAKRERSFVAALTVDSGRGLMLTGKGSVQGQPVTLRVSGGPIDDAHAAAPWPFRVEIAGDAVGMTLAGRADRALDLGHFSAAASGHGADLKLLDAIIEAGLPATQPVRFTANVRRDAPQWAVTGLRGTIGQSDIAGTVTVAEQGDRHRIDAVLTSNRFDFEDLSSPAGRRLGAEKLARFGPRLIPDTPIDLAHLAQTDGDLKVRVTHLLWPGSNPFRTLDTTLRLDHSLLTADPLRFSLPHGTMTGKVAIDQRSGDPPRLGIAFDIADARLIDILPAAMIDGDLRGRIRLVGRGRTIRDAIGASDGAIGFAARDGRIPARTAALLGEDVGGALTAGTGDATMRCLIARMAVTRGTARPAPLLIDTSRALSHASGTVDLASERLALTMTGAPKRGSLLRYAGTVSLTGTIKRHVIVVPPQAKSVGGILKMIGHGLSGHQGPTASDVDCAALARSALR